MQTPGGSAGNCGRREPKVAKWRRAAPGWRVTLADAVERCEKQVPRPSACEKGETQARASVAWQAPPAGYGRLHTRLAQPTTTFALPRHRLTTLLHFTSRYLLPALLRPSPPLHLPPRSCSISLFSFALGSDRTASFTRHSLTHSLSLIHLVLTLL